MVGNDGTRKSHIGWIVVHGGFLVWGLCLIVLAKERQESAEDSAAIAEKPTSFGTGWGEASSNPSSRWVDAQITALGDNTYSVRSKATRQLLSAGPNAVEPLTIALESSDPEVARRSLYILSQMVRTDEASLLALERIARSPAHRAATLAEAIHDRERERRERMLAAAEEHRQIESQRLLREARADIGQNRLADARQKTAAAHALKCNYNLFDDRPELVLEAIQHAEARIVDSQVTVDRK